MNPTMGKVIEFPAKPVVYIRACGECGHTLWEMHCEGNKIACANCGHFHVRTWHTEPEPPKGAA